jgi:hypothetical protein
MQRTHEVARTVARAFGRTAMRVRPYILQFQSLGTRLTVFGTPASECLEHLGMLCSSRPPWRATGRKKVR